MILTYNCEEETIKICDIKGKKLEYITLSSTASCCTDGVPITYYNSDACKNAPIKNIRFSNYTYYGHYNPDLCTGGFAFNWTLDLQNVSSVVGTLTITPEAGSPVISNINNISQLTGSLQYYLTQPGELYEFSLEFTTTQGCVILVKAYFTTICQQCQCGIDLPVGGVLSNTLITNVPNIYTLDEHMCASINLPLENGIVSIDIETNEEIYSECILVDCDDWLCKITKKIADNILCTNCDINLDESFKLYLEYQMLLSLLDCSKCCQACQLYNKIDNELSKCSSC